MVNEVNFVRKCIAADTSQHDLWGKLVCSNFRISFLTDDPMPFQVGLAGDQRSLDLGSGTWGAVIFSVSVPLWNAAHGAVRDFPFPGRAALSTSFEAVGGPEQWDSGERVCLILGIPESPPNQPGVISAHCCVWPQNKKQIRDKLKQLRFESL